MSELNDLKAAYDAADEKLDEASEKYLELVTLYNNARAAFKKANGHAPVYGVDSLSAFGFDDNQMTDFEARLAEYNRASQERRAAKAAYKAAQEAASQEALDAQVDLATKKAQSKKALAEASKNPQAAAGAILIGSSGGDKYYRKNGKNYVVGRDGSIMDLGYSTETSKEKQSKQKTFTKLENKYVETNLKEELEKQRKEQKAAEKKQREAEAEKEKARIKAEHDKRAAARKANEEEYEKQLADYKQKREAELAERKKEREAAAKKRQQEYVEQRKALAEEGETSGKKGYQAVNDYTYTAITQYAAQEEERKKTGVGYTGSSAQAKKELKDSIKDLWNMSAGDAVKEVSGAYKGMSSSIDTLKSAKDIVNDLVKGKTVTDGISSLKDASLAIQAAALNAKDKDGMLEIQKAILAQKLASRVVMDQIVDAVQMKMDALKDAGTMIKDTVLLQKAYIAAYVKQTFGNPQFMANVMHVVSIKVDNLVEAMAMEKVADVNKKIDTIFTRVDDKIDKVEKKSYEILDKAAKIDVLESFNSTIDKFTSLDSLQKKLDKSPFGFVLSPIVGAVAAVGNIAVKGMLSASGITGAVAKVQQKIVGLQSQITKAKAFVASRVQMVRDYVNKLKEKAQAAVKKFADQVVADIKSKISSALAGAFAGKGVSF